MAIKRNIFISYHHANDQQYCDTIRSVFCNDFNGIFSDNSLQRALNSNNATYIDRIVRENYIRGSSATIVLCGQDTYLRKFVDWEIHDTLNENHGLLGIILPSCEKDYSSGFARSVVPERLHDNLQSGYARLLHWPFNHYQFQQEVESCVQQARASVKSNIRPLKQNNGYRRH